ncbi:hypothetical protein [Fibrobacter sp. UWR2]|uniref:hypothetical protein n=1 Tax=Fibrobacter sp. UWR2 TaxID=1964352 RepID=UPI000B523372|nr:hypothetical protein [Fibrobacter sp. UWR2]OWV01801.1 hypothetical protein B7994_00795 [Fibrobacter sp. UWR2]
MPKLKTVIASILNAIDSAQHQSNLTTSKLAKQYSKDELLKYLQLPNAVMSEVDITLRYAVEEFIEGNTLNTTKKLQSIEPQITLNRSANQATAEKLIDKLRTSLPEKEALILDDDIKRKALISRVQETLYASGIEKKSADDTSTAVAKVLSSSLLGDTEISSSQKKALSDIITNERQNIENFTAEQIGELEVIVDGTTLSGLSPEVIQTLHITTKLENYRWVENPHNPSGGDFVIVD